MLFRLNCFTADAAGFLRLLLPPLLLPHLPPPNAVPHDQPDGGREDDEQSGEEHERPAEPDGLDQGVDDGCGDGAEQAADDVVAGARGAGVARVDVDDEDIERVAEADEGEAQQGEQDARHGERGAVLQRPAPGYYDGGREREEWEAGLEARALDRETCQVSLLVGVVRHAQPPAVPAEVPILQPAHHHRRRDRPPCHRQVHEPHLGLAEPVQFAEGRRH